MFFTFIESGFDYIRKNLRYSDITGYHFKLMGKYKSLNWADNEYVIVLNKKQLGSIPVLECLDENNNITYLFLDESHLDFVQL